MYAYLHILWMKIVVKERIVFYGMENLYAKIVHAYKIYLMKKKAVDSITCKQTICPNCKNAINSHLSSFHTLSVCVRGCVFSDISSEMCTKHQHIIKLPASHIHQLGALYVPVNSKHILIK